MKPKALDLFCGADGATKGLQCAGFYVVGVDIQPQPHYYGDEFYQADALNFPLEGFDFYWASPPCQFGSMATQQWRSEGRVYQNLIPATRDRLIKTGLPYVIENVVGAPYLRNPIKLNGAFFGLMLRRTRYFETSFPIDLILLPKEIKSSVRMGRPINEGDIITPVGHFSNIPYAKKVMDIDWMTGKELSQAIPPVYAEFIARKFLEGIEL